MDKKAYKGLLKKHIDNFFKDYDKVKELYHSKTTTIDETARWLEEYLAEILSDNNYVYIANIRRIDKKSYVKIYRDGYMAGQRDLLKGEQNEGE